MNFNWNNYLTLAEYLNANVISEASKRSSISRSYYSVFHKARIFCLNRKIIKDYEATGRDCHIIISEKLIEKDDQELLEIAQLIASLRERRKKADYDSEYSITSTFVNDTIEKSKYIIELITNSTYRN